MNKLILFFCCISVVYSEQTVSIDELKKEIVEILPELYGWCSKEKAMNYMDLVLEVKPSLCVEIGVFGGASLLPVAVALDYLQRGTVVAIDPWDKIECIRYLDPDLDTENLRWWTHINLDHVYYSFVQLLRQFEVEKSTLILRKTSKKAAPIIGAIDILHLDGNHYPKMVLEDATLYVPKVKKGGYVWLNDSSWAAFKPAIDLILESCDIVKTIDGGNCTLFKKR